MALEHPIPPNLVEAWTRPVEEFVAVDPPEMSAGLRERHRMYSLVLLALLASKWNGNKYGNPGNYSNWRSDQLATGQYAEPGLYEGGTYFGHNIAALAVDARGNIVDYEFNHNDLFTSSVEHAESRLLRRLFSLSRVSEWTRTRATKKHPKFGLEDFDLQSILLAFSDPPIQHPSQSPLPAFKRTPYSKLLTDVTIYTSLESCAQCSGIMALADVREVVYLQPDLGQYLIGNFMFKATQALGFGARAPWPIPATAFGLEHYSQLDAAFGHFSQGVVSDPFFVSADEMHNDISVTSFLCTDAALRIARSGATELEHFQLARPGYQRLSRDLKKVPGAATNQSLRSRARTFLDFVTIQGDRGTAHRA